jgi:hypothetical protein
MKTDRGRKRGNGKPEDVIEKYGKKRKKKYRRKNGE